MKVLVTNDDGFNEAGLEELCKSLSVQNEVYVLAPQENNSGVSNKINTTRHLYVEKKRDKVWTLDGTPCDCVMTALKGDIMPLPDIVVSGINRGANVGTDIVYSGTCGAARQAVLNGVPGVALSVEADTNAFPNGDGYYYKALADFAAKNLEAFIKMCAVSGKGGSIGNEPCVFVNVNALSRASYNNVKFAGVSFREYRNDTINLVQKNNGSFVREFKFGVVDTKGFSFSDYDAMSEGAIAITRIFAEPVSAPTMDDIKFLL